MMAATARRSVRGRRARPDLHPQSLQGSPENGRLPLKVVVGKLDFWETFDDRSDRNLRFQTSELGP